MKPIIQWPAVVALLAIAACGSHSGGGPGPTSNPPQIACPADVTVSGVAAPSQAVTFNAPTVSEGAPPVNVVCSPASGATFPLGTTPVGCQATDAMSRQASCSFNVILKGLSLSVTKYDAFGDSLTEGETGRPSVTPTVLDPPNAYPVKLQAAFDAVYPGQATVINRGKSGDTVETTLATIKTFVRSDRPGAVLVLSGYNNLTTPCGPGDANTLACRAGIDQVGFGIRDCLRAVKEANVGVKFTFVSTLTPPGATGSERIDANAIIQANTRIRQMTAAEGGVLVDSYAAFLGHEAEYVNVDGLHLRPAGYQALADGFFAIIQTTIPQTPLFGLTFPR